MLLVAAIVLSGGILKADNAYRFLVGTYTSGTSSQGIYSLGIDMGTGKTDIKVATTDAQDPSYLALTPDKKFAYSISERGENNTLSAYAFASESGKLTLINTVYAGGEAPCFVAVSANHAFCANYSGGSLSAFARKADGALSDTVQVIRHTGSSIDPERQTKPYVHQVMLAPDGRFLLVNDLGTDYVTSYAYDPNTEKAPLQLYNRIKLKNGSGPRHLTFSKDGKYVYVLQEIDGSLSTLSYKKGKLKLLAVTTVIRNSTATAGAADIHISPDGKFLYATNRGTANDISCFSIGRKGKLSFVEQVSVQGVGPRNFTVTADGKYILVGNQRTNQIVVFGRDETTGKLKDTSFRADIPAPVCLVEY